MAYAKIQYQNLKIIIPSIDEQKQIINYLNLEISKIDSLILKTKSFIEKLYELRQSLISSTVTGKIDVRGAVA